ncbi:MAG TPA: LUD domain-containing protein [Solirubrobacteraceae bacterium]|nr:LUD domain-containing protein [Solirubrobacteraceae bacterium]
MSAARDAILARVRAALADVPPGEADRWDGPGPPGSPDAYERGAALDGDRLVALFAERCADYRARVVRCAGGDAAIAAAVADACDRERARALLTPHDLPAAWLPDAVEALADDPSAPLDVAALDAAPGVLTGCALAIAETGTIVLDAGSGQGRRALTLVPDLHVCVVRAADVVATVPEAVQQLAGAAAAGRPITFVSGPSATSDIELDRVEGVHGPRRLVVVLAA